MAQITCQDLCLGYSGKIIAENINFTINAGDYLCIVGENGTGKSTLLKSILGLRKAISGKIILGDDTAQRDFGYLTQHSQMQKDFPVSVYEIVMSGFQSKCGLRPFYSKKEKASGKSAMEKMQVLELKNKCFGELSGGQQQRVLLSRALCATNKILFLDEPVAGLDQNVTEEFYEVIHELNAKENISIVMISHDLESAMKYASHILHIGDSIFYGTKEEYLKDETSHIFHSLNGGETL